MKRSLIFTAAMLASAAAWPPTARPSSTYCVRLPRRRGLHAADRKIRSPETLRLQVLRCNAMTKSASPTRTSRRSPTTLKQELLQF